MTGRQVWWNGKFLDEAQARVSIYDEALMFGSCVFEMTRSFNKKQFKLKEHLNRLFNGLKILRIQIPYTAKDLEEAINKTIEKNDVFFDSKDEHRIMINVTRGLLSIYEGITGIDPGPNIIIADFPLRWTVSKMGHLFDSGINAVVPSQRTIPASLIDPKIKNRSRIHYLMANIEVSQYRGEDNWALLLDPDNFIAEGTGDNFFIVKGKKVITPEGRNILRGISRDYVMELCGSNSIECIEKNIDIYDVYTADEAFMTGTPFCMLPVTKINGLPIGEGKPGKIFGRLLDLWSNNVDLDIAQQIKEYEREASSIGLSGPSPYEFK